MIPPIRAAKLKVEADIPHEEIYRTTASILWSFLIVFIFSISILLLYLSYSAARSELKKEQNINLKLDDAVEYQSRRTHKLLMTSRRLQRQIDKVTGVKR